MTEIKFQPCTCSSCKEKHGEIIYLGEKLGTTERQIEVKTITSRQEGSSFLENLWRQNQIPKEEITNTLSEIMKYF
jgi:hypothetical protein